MLYVGILSDNVILWLYLKELLFQISYNLKVLLKGALATRTIRFVGRMSVEDRRLKGYTDNVSSLVARKWR